jgi:hypothetical protein
MVYAVETLREVQPIAMRIVYISIPPLVGNEPRGAPF